MSAKDIQTRVYEMKNKVPSQKWAIRFFKRHPDEFEFKQGRPLDPKRARAFNATTANAHFTLLTDVIKQYRIPPENIYNMDKKGIQIGSGKKASMIKRIFIKGDKSRYVLKGDSMLLVTIIEAVCADGTACPPCIIMPVGETGEWISVSSLGGFAQTTNGWTDNNICHQWFEKTFIPFVQGRNKSGKPILLTSDGHQSHKTSEMHALAFGNNIILYRLPPHTTHKLQPLDVGVFGPFQRAWVQHFTHKNVVERYMEVPETDAFLQIRSNHVSAKAISAAFQKAGMWPVNREAYSHKDYAPSLAFAKKQILPVSFPEPVVSSPVSACMTDGLPSDLSSDVEYIPEESDDEDGHENSHPTCLASPPPPNHMDITESHFAMETPCAPWTRGQYQNITMQLTGLSSASSARWTLFALPPNSLHEENQKLQTQVYSLELENEGLYSQLDAANAHCTIIKNEIETLQEQINSKRRKTQRVPNTFATVLTPPEGYDSWKAKDDAEKAKKRAEAEKSKEKADTLAAREQAWKANLGAMSFNRTLGQYTLKEDIKGIAACFGLPLDGTRDHILDRITTYLNYHPELCDDARYSALFPGTRGRKRHENIPGIEGNEGSTMDGIHSPSGEELGRDEGGSEEGGTDSEEEAEGQEIFWNNIDPRLRNV
ncbi:hypothetical protein M422DRAFT_159282 [Sphaerobolus stellatus SS14]|nr:hypothetical protein M422DRAFT_159282 [Sphaerobolus stellatus SS14]